MFSLSLLFTLHASHQTTNLPKTTKSAQTQIHRKHTQTQNGRKTSSKENKKNKHHRKKKDGPKAHNDISGSFFCSFLGDFFFFYLVGQVCFRLHLLKIVLLCIGVDLQQFLLIPHHSESDSHSTTPFSSLWCGRHSTYYYQTKDAEQGVVVPQVIVCCSTAYATQRQQVGAGTDQAKLLG